MKRQWATATVGASTKDQLQARAKALDGYSTPPIAVHRLLDVEPFKPLIWEPAAGKMQIVGALRERGHDVYTSDIYRWHPEIETQRAFERFDRLPYDCDVITNPPFKHAEAFVRHALKLLPKGGKLALLLRVQFLEGQKRFALFRDLPPKRVHVFSARIPMMHGFLYQGKQSTSLMAFAWFVWVKGHIGPTTLKWIPK